MPPIYIWICKFEPSINSEVAKTKELMLDHMVVDARYNVVSKISLIFSPP